MEPCILYISPSIMKVYNILSITDRCIPCIQSLQKPSILYISIQWKPDGRTDADFGIRIRGKEGARVEVMLVRMYGRKFQD